MKEVEVVLQARTPKIGELIEACANKQITFDECCRSIAALGFKTTSVYEMVMAIRQQENK